MRTITTPQARRRQTIANARARLGLLFPADLSTDSDLLAPTAGKATPSLPRSVHGAESDPDDLPEHLDGAEDFTEASEAEPAAVQPTSAPDPPYALSSPRILAMYGVPARSAHIAPEVEAAPHPYTATQADAVAGLLTDREPPSGRRRPEGTPERDPPAEPPAPDHAPSQRRPADPWLPGGSRSDIQPEPEPEPDPDPDRELDLDLELDPSCLDPLPPNAAAVSHTAQPRLPLRFRLPAALALDRRAVLGLTVLLVLAIGYAVQHFWLGRPQPVPVPAIAVAESTLDRTSEGALAPRPEGPPLVVDIGGKVHHPGLRTLPAGSRVADALAAAGGVLPGTDTDFLNLARPLTDGEQILVGVDTIAAGGAPAAPAGPVSLNRASADQLDSLPGVGPALAQRILQYRLAHGPFRSLDQLRQVPGIGPRKYDDLKALLTL